MPDPRDPSPSEPSTQGARDAGRFWERYGRSGDPAFAKSDAAAGGGGVRAEHEPHSQAGNGAGARTGPAPETHECLEWCPVCRGAEVVRASASPELREQWQGLQRDALVMLRSALDMYLERLGESERRQDSGVEDIPIR